MMSLEKENERLKSLNIELLEALESVLENYIHGYMPADYTSASDCVDKARAVIIKAKGE